MNNYTLQNMGVAFIIAILLVGFLLWERSKITKENKEQLNLLRKAKVEYGRVYERNKTLNNAFKTQNQAYLNYLINDIKKELASLDGRVNTVEEAKRKEELRHAMNFLESRK